jgi:hypothetical protein
MSRVEKGIVILVEVESLRSKDSISIQTPILTKEVKRHDRVRFEEAFEGNMKPIPMRKEENARKNRGKQDENISSLPTPHPGCQSIYSRRPSLNGRVFRRWSRC